MVVMDFMSVAHAEIPLADQGLVLIEGENRDDPTAESNGAGKSTVFEALLWGLYGVTARGLTNEEVVKHGEKTAQVSVEFEDDSGATWIVARQAVPTKLVLTRDDVPQTLGRIRDTQEKLESVVGMDASTFTSTVMFGQGNVAPFSTMTDAEQKEVMEKLIGLEDIEEAHQRAKAEAGALGAKLDLVQQDLTRDREESMRLSREYVAALDNALAWGAQQKSKLKAQDGIIRKVEKDADVQDIGPYERKVEKAKQDLADREAISQELGEKVKRTSREWAEAEARRETLKSQISAFDSIGPTCRTCKQPLDPKHKAKHLTELRREFAEADALVAKRMATRVEAEEDYNEDVDAVKAARDRLSDLKTNLTEVKTANASAEKAQVNLKTLRKQYTAMENETNTWDAQAKKLKAQASVAKKAVEDGEEKEEALTVDVKHANFLVAMFSNKGLKSYILDAVVPFLNQHVNRYAGVLSGDALQVVFNTQTMLKTGEMREKFSVEVTNAHGADVYRGNSGGEKRKVDVAIALALQALAAARAKSQINVSFWDEPFDALDATAGEYAMELLREEAKKKDSVFVITHREEFKANFSHVWRAVKTNNTTTVET